MRRISVPWEGQQDTENSLYMVVLNLGDSPLSIVWALKLRKLFCYWPKVDPTLDNASIWKEKTEYKHYNLQ